MKTSTFFYDGDIINKVRSFTEAFNSLIEKIKEEGFGVDIKVDEINKISVKIYKDF